MTYSTAGRLTLADRYAANGPAIGDELRCTVDRLEGATVRVLAIFGRTIVVAQRGSTLRQAYDRDELAPIAARVLTGR